MKYYIEITLLPGTEIGLYFLWQKVYQQIHLGLVELKNEGNETPIGVSFPEYVEETNFLGKKLRIFGKNKEIFESFKIRDLLNRLSDYVHITSIKDVPAGVNSFVIFKRQQIKSSSIRLARRKVKREGITIEQALTALSGYSEKRVKTPYINMESLSTQKENLSLNKRYKFRLFIQKQSAEQPYEGSFNCYGLSKIATVPCF